MKSFAAASGRIVAFVSLALSLVGSAAFGADSPSGAVEAPPPLVPGAKVMTLWPANSPTLKWLDQKEAVTFSKSQPDHILKVTNINNPSIEIHLAPADKANGAAIVVAAGGGNRELNVGPEGTEVADWLNSIGVSAFVLRYRLVPYKSDVDALADTQRSMRLVRANAKEWGVDPKKVGYMGFSAGGEQAARLALTFDHGNPDAADPIERESDRPDFVVLVYAGWRGDLDYSHLAKDMPPAFLMSAGVDDAFHAKETVDFYNAMFNAKVPVELHIYGHGGHAGSLSPRHGIPMGTWQYRFLEWATDLKFIEKAKN